jgi:hypothetical protein
MEPVRPHSRRVVEPSARIAGRRGIRRIENRFLWNHRDPLTNRSLWRNRSGSECASVVRRALVETAAACGAARRGVRQLGSQALSGPAPSPGGLPEN